MNILFIEDLVPDPLEGSGFPRSFQILKVLLELDHKVTIYPTREDGEFPGVEVVSGGIVGFEKFVKSREFDIVFICRPPNMEKLSEIIRKNLKRAKIVYDMESLWHKREILKSTILEPISKNKIAHLTRRAFIFAKLAHRVVVVSEDDKMELDPHCKDVCILGHATAIRRPIKSFSEREGILFVGRVDMGSPNEDAITHFLKFIRPIMDIPVEITIAGKNTSDKMKNVILAGCVENLDNLYENNRIFIAPHRFAAGIPIKIIEAMANGIPCVVTSLLASQLNIEKEAIISKTDAEFAKKARQLYEREDIWLSIQENGLKFVKKKLQPI